MEGGRWKAGGEFVGELATWQSRVEERDGRQQADGGE